MVDPYTVCIPAVPPSLNEWRKWHWSKQSKARQEWQQMVCALLHEKGNVRPTCERIRVRSVLSFKLNRRRDSDNFGAVLAKWTQDAFTLDGLIPDDTHDRCTFEPPVIVTGTAEQTLLIIEDLGGKS
jgi:adenosylmethionine-8-amino-7-oxononanoate aminotransferase